MTRSTLLLLLAITLTAPACSNAPGKPAPVVNEGIPVDVMEFAPLFKTYCAGCHGADGQLGPAPPLNDSLFLRIVPPEELSKVITLGRPGTAMPPFGRTEAKTPDKRPKPAGVHVVESLLTSAQIKVLVEGLTKTWGKPAAPPEPPPYFGPAGDAARGKTHFATACAGCHGDHGQGATQGAINDPAFLALMSDQVLRRIIITGRPDLKMPDYAGREGRPGDFKPLDSQAVADIAAFVATWRTPIQK